jgi:CRISPR-associated endonuclease/helicase Cas3
MERGRTLKRPHSNNERKDVVAAPYEKCLAKLKTSEDGTNVPGATVEEHCRIVGEVADELASRYPAWIREMWFPQGVGLVSSVHDVGKISPLFQEKIHRGITGYVPNSYPGLQNARPELETVVGMHSGIGKIALQNENRYVAEIAGCHHGYASDNDRVLPDDEIVGGPKWQAERERFIRRMKETFRTDWPVIQDDLHAAVIAGLTTVADWIGSGDEECSETSRHETARVKEMVDRAGFIIPEMKKGLSFSDVFDFSPRPMQEAFVRQVDRKGVYILEASMGEGKTEAALYAAYLLMVTGQATGIYFALPTQLTSEKIYTRVQSFIDRVVVPSTRQSVMLAHGEAWLFEFEMGEEGGPGHSWFDSRKRKLLAPFAVGTVDQALMAVLNVKHAFVRTFGLLGKVVILDEVHTYDAYTGTIIDHLVETLVRLGCSVIILSATLTLERKNRFLGAEPHVEVPEHYPLITSMSTTADIDQETSQRYRFSEPLGSEQSDVKVIHETDAGRAMTIAWEHALEGEYVLWIENAVHDAQITFRLFAAWAAGNSVEVGLLHSRFPGFRRSQLDDYWVGLYGKGGEEKRSLQGRILIGTQVLEQSLDIDADLLVTRIAPTDMLLQRIGRLWRHRILDKKRPSSAERMVVVLEPDATLLVHNPFGAFGSSGAVYSPYVLMRSLEIWRVRDNIAIPGDMRMLIEETYADRVESGAMQAMHVELEKKREILARKALNGMTMIGKGSSDSTSTRYSELNSCDVLLLRGGSDLYRGYLKLLDGDTVVLPAKASLVGKKERMEIIRKLMKNLISVYVGIAPNVSSLQELNALKPYLYLAENETDRLRVGLVLDSGIIVSLSGLATNDVYGLEYSPILGYMANKKEGS